MSPQKSATPKMRSTNTGGSETGYKRKGEDGRVSGDRGKGGRVQEAGGREAGFQEAGSRI
jgi:hypothetical protein